MADDDELDIARTPDKRMQHGELRRKEKEGTGRQGPSPYDVASDDMRDDRVIEKGEREKPGPTGTELSREDEELDEADDMLQSDELKRTETVAGMGGMSGSLEDEEMQVANEESGTLGGEAHHRRINNEQVREDMLGDEESA
jgi:hypothetical protein